MVDPIQGIVEIAKHGADPEGASGALNSAMTATRPSLISIWKDFGTILHHRHDITSLNQHNLKKHSFFAEIFLGLTLQKKILYAQLKVSKI